MILLDANENAFGPALELSDNASIDTTPVSTNGSTKQAIDLLKVNRLNRYPDPYAMSLIRINCSFLTTSHPIKAST